MNHSIFGAAAHILRGDVAVAYSGDLRQERRFDEGVRKSGKGGVRPYHPGDPRRAGRSSRWREDRCEAPSPQYRPGGLPGGEGGGGSPPAFEGEHHASVARVPGRPGLGHRPDRPGPDRPHRQRGEGVVRRELRGCGACGGGRGDRVLGGAGVATTRAGRSYFERLFS